MFWLACIPIVGWLKENRVEILCNHIAWIIKNRLLYTVFLFNLRVVNLMVERAYLKRKNDSQKQVSLYFCALNFKCNV